MSCNYEKNKITVSKLEYIEEINLVKRYIIRYIEIYLKNPLKANIVKSKIEKINPNRGVIDKGSRIIAKGEVVEGNKFQILFI